MRVLLDTNFLIDIVRFKIDLNGIKDITPGELTILSSVERELKRISSGTTKSGTHAKVALKLIEEYHIKILKSDETPDNAVLKLDGIVATNDRDLRKKLRALGRKTIYLKSKKHLAMD